MKRLLLAALLSTTVLAQGGFDPALLDRLTSGVTPRGYTPTGITPYESIKLMIFGSAEHKVYLGCLSCSEHAKDSVRNAYGDHGSPDSKESIFNHFSPYGSPYDSESACNEYATDPPVIVDQNGVFYGRLTLNRYAPDIGIGTRLLAVLSASCHRWLPMTHHIPITQDMTKAAGDPITQAITQDDMLGIVFLEVFGGMYKLYNPIFKTAIKRKFHSVQDAREFAIEHFMDVHIGNGRAKD